MPKLINIRGTSGAGKTTLARAIMDAYGARTSYRIEGRKQPIGYLFKHPNGGRDLAVIGHYESDCGGCDTISLGFETIFGLVRQNYEAGHDVLFEGLLISGDVRHYKALFEDVGEDLNTVYLHVDYDTCVASINKRRQDKYAAHVAEVARFNEELEQLHDETGKKVAKPRGARAAPEEYTDAKGNTLSKFKAMEKQRVKFDEAGIPYIILTRLQALPHCLGILGVES